MTKSQPSPRAVQDGVQGGVQESGLLTAAGPPDDGDEIALSLVRGDVAFRLQRALGLIPRRGLGVGRRALTLAAISWAPIAIWALATGRAFAGSSEPLLQHFGVSVRCLVAIPVLVLAEAGAQESTRRLLPQFLRSGLVADGDRPRFLAILRDTARLRDMARPWVVLAALVTLWAFASDPRTHELIWAGDGGSRRLGFGGLWFVYVARPLYQLLALAWLWRLLLLALLLGRIARLPLALVPTHPDGAGGLGFLAGLPRFFAPVVLAVAAVVAARWAHDAWYHDVAVATLRTPMLGFVVLMVALFVAPLVVFAPCLAAARRAALLEYGALVARHGRRVRERWIEGRPVADDGLLAAPELGPVADTLALYGAVKAMRSVPVDRGTLVAIAAPAALPMLAVLAIQVPLKDLLLKVLKAVV